MPHILLYGYHSEMQIKMINIHVRVQLKDEIHNTARGDQKLQEIADKLEAVLREYYEESNMEETEILSNHEYNCKMS